MKVYNNRKILPCFRFKEINKEDIYLSEATKIRWPNKQI